MKTLMQAGFSPRVRRRRDSAVAASRHARRPISTRPTAPPVTKAACRGLPIRSSSRCSGLPRSSTRSSPASCERKARHSRRANDGHSRNFSAAPRSPRNTVALKHCEVMQVRFRAPAPARRLEHDARRHAFRRRAACRAHPRTSPARTQVGVCISRAPRGPFATDRRRRRDVRRQPGRHGLRAGLRHGLRALDVQGRCGSALEPDARTWPSGDAKASRALLRRLQGQCLCGRRANGQLQWKTRVEAHPRVTITGSPRLFQGRLFVPMSSNEWAAAADPAYECCTFRGGVTAIDADTASSCGVPTRSRRNRSLPAKRTLPAHCGGILPARRSGIRRRSTPSAVGSTSARAKAILPLPRPRRIQSSPTTSIRVACSGGTSPCRKTRGTWRASSAAVPTARSENGPDLDIGAPPILHRLPSGKDVLLVGQKSADVFALDPQDGRLVWKVRYGRGGYAGGVHWGMAATATHVCAKRGHRVPRHRKRHGKARPVRTRPEGRLDRLVHAGSRCLHRGAEARVRCRILRAADRDTRRGVSALVRRPVRAYGESDGKLLWEFNTRANSIRSRAKRPTAVDRKRRRVVADGSVIVNSGYLFGGRMPGNVLLVFAVPAQEENPMTREADRSTNGT